MAARVVATIVLAAIAVACAPTAAQDGASASPSASVFGTRSPEPSASPSATPAASGILRGAKRVPLEAGTNAVNADTDVLIVTRQLVDGHTTRVEALDLATGNVTPVHEATDAAVTVPSIRDGVITLLETRETDVPMQLEARVLAGRWRDPKTIVELDRFTFGLAGGDGWTAFPYPQTNGWEVAWMHTSSDGAHEVRVREADGQLHAIYASNGPYSFALGRYGDVAIGEFPTSATDRPALRLYSAGTLRTLAERTADEGAGYVAWELGLVVWPRSFVARFTTSIDRIAPGSLSRETVKVPAGCDDYAGVGAEMLAFRCGDHLQLEDGTKLGPPMPLLHERTIVFVPQDVQRIATVIPADTDEPRPGAGARF